MDKPAGERLEAAGGGPMSAEVTNTRRFDRVVLAVEAPSNVTLKELTAALEALGCRHVQVYPPAAR